MIATIIIAWAVCAAFTLFLASRHGHVFDTITGLVLTILLSPILVWLGLGHELRRGRD